ALDVGPEGLTELEASGLWVKRVVLDALHAPSLPQSVPLIGGDQAWSRGFDGTGAVVAILDTGVESTHPFLGGKVVEEACYSSNFSGHSITLCPNGSTQQTGPGAGPCCPLPRRRHGTLVGGIAARPERRGAATAGGAVWPSREWRRGRRSWRCRSSRSSPTPRTAVVLRPASWPGHRTSSPGWSKCTASGARGISPRRISASAAAASLRHATA